MKDLKTSRERQSRRRQRRREGVNFRVNESKKHSHKRTTLFLRNCKSKRNITRLPQSDNLSKKKKTKIR